MSKTILVNSMVVSSIMLFLISFFVGRNMEEKKIQAEKREKQEQKVKDEGQFSYSTPELEEDADHQEKSPGKHQHEHYKMDNPEADKNDVPVEKSNTLADFFTQEELDESRKVAEAFITLYYPFNGDNPLENIENAKIHMSKALYDSFKGQQPARPTQTIYKKELTSCEVYEPYNPTDLYITWNVRVKGKIFNSKGELSNEESYDYTLKLIKEDASYKVDKLAINVAH